MKSFLCLFFLLSLSLFGANEKTVIRSFKTDGCTGWFDQTSKYDWKKCCVLHDLYFWAGGIKEDRKLADLRLKACVKKEANSFHATLIYFGVKSGSFSPIKIKSKKWGNAWEEIYQYSKLEKNDLFLLKKSLQETLKKNPELEDYLSQTELDAFFKEVESLNTEEKEDPSNI